MVLHNIPATIFSSECADYPSKKQQILDAIASIGMCSVKTASYQLSHTDWHLSNQWARPYWDLVVGDIHQHIHEIKNACGASTYTIDSFWMQQYGDGDFHSWHCHGNSMFSSVYYVELPETVPTTFKFLGKEFTVDCKEGDIITFPSYLTHCSKPNKTGARKTVISFNFSFTSVNEG